MKIRRWHCYLVINCALIIPCIVAKSISLNEIIAAENQRKQALESTPQPKVRETTESFAPKTTPGKKTPWIKSRKLKRNYSPLHKAISLLKYGKSYAVKSPLKPSKLKYKFLNKLKNQSTKREIGDNEDIKGKYSPLLRNLGVFFNNILKTDVGDSSEVINERKYKRRKNKARNNGTVCTCTRKSSYEESHAESRKKTITVTTPFSFEDSNAPKVTTEATSNTTVGNVSSIRSHKDISLLLSRNTSSSWRNHNGHSKRSGPALHGSIKRNITGNNGNSKYLTRIRENASCTESNEENTYCNSRDNASSNGFRRGHKNNTRDPSTSRITTKNIKLSKGEDISTRFTAELQRKIKHDDRGNETESRKSIPKYDRGSRGFISKNKVCFDTKSIQSKEDNEESHNRISYDRTGDKRIPSGSSTIASENKNVTEELETIMFTKVVSNLTSHLQTPDSILETDNGNVTEELETISIKDLSNIALQTPSSTLARNRQNIKEKLGTVVVPIKKISNVTLASHILNSTVATDDQNITEELKTVTAIKDSSDLTLASQNSNSTRDTEDQNITEELKTVTAIKDSSDLTLPSQSSNSTRDTEDQDIPEELETVIAIKDSSNLTLTSQNSNSTRDTEDQNITEELETVIAIKDSSNLTLALRDSNSTLATEDENITEELETVISIKDLSNLTLALQGPPKGKVHVVTIFGGYSVARDINGQNKISEQSIIIHS